MENVITQAGSRCFALTGSDTQDISETTKTQGSVGGGRGAIPFARKLRITADGTVKITTTGGDVLTYTMTAGQVIDWVLVKKLWSTGTTAAVEACY